MSDYALTLDNVTVSYGADPVVKNVSFSINKGEVFGLMGLNGAGKTTIIKNILGLREPDEGKIQIYGSDKASRDSKKATSYLPEKFEPPSFLTGVEFLKFSLSLYGQDCDVEYMKTIAKGLALDPDALFRRVQSYSKGMRQKIGLMGTMLTGCHLFILDEPMSGLDPRARALVKKMLLDMKSHDDTIFLSSHVLADMEEICDRVALLHNCEIQFIGKPAELKTMMNVDNLEQAFLEFIECRDAA